MAGYTIVFRQRDFTIAGGSTNVKSTLSRASLVLRGPRLLEFVGLRIFSLIKGLRAFLFWPSLSGLWVVRLKGFAPSGFGVHSFLCLGLVTLWPDSPMRFFIQI